MMYRDDSLAAVTSAESLILTLWWISYRSLRPRRIAIVSSTDGSPTKTGWNRRSRAGSFSMCSRNSSSVVAPMQRSSPRARAGLKQVGGVHRAFGLAGADDQVQLVDEQDDPALRLGHFLEHGLEPLFEFAAELGAGDQRAHVERDQPAVLQALGHVARDDALGQPLDDGRLAHARLADQDRVVLGPAAEDLHDAADLGIAADHRVHLAVAGQLDQVAAVALQGLVLVLGALVGDALAAADLLQRLEHLLLGDPQRLEQCLRPALDLQEGQQQVLDRDVLVLHPLGLGLRGLEDLVELGADRQLAAGHLGKTFSPSSAAFRIWAGLTPSWVRSERTTCWSGCKSAASRCIGSSRWCPRSLASVWACLHRLLALERELLETKGHDTARGRGYFFSSNSTSMTSSGLYRRARPSPGGGPRRRPGGGPRVRAGPGPGLAPRVEMLGHRLAGSLELVERAVDGRRVVLLLGLVDLVDGRADGRAVRLAELVLAFLDQLFELVDPLLGGVPGLGQLAPLLVLGGVRLGVALHPLDLVLVEAAGRLDAGSSVSLPVPWSRAVTFKMPLASMLNDDLDLGHAHAGRRNALEVEFAQEPVVGGHRPLALVDLDRDGRLVVVGRGERLLSSRSGSWCSWGRGRS